jgi:hypothetical protein
MSRQFRKCAAECTEHRIHLSDGTPIDADNNPLDTKGEPILKCVESIYDRAGWGTHECGKKLKGDPEYPSLCGLHVSAIRRARAKRAEEEAVWKARNEAGAALNARIEAVSGPLGLDIRQSSVTTGRVSVDIDQLEALAKRVAKLESALAEAERMWLG